MPYFKIPYTGYTLVEADSPEEALEAYDNDDTILDDCTRQRPELIDENEFNRLFNDWE